MEKDNNKTFEKEAIEQNSKMTEQSTDIEDDELAQGFLDMRRSIQRMNHRRDAWTRR